MGAKSLTLYKIFYIGVPLSVIQTQFPPPPLLIRLGQVNYCFRTLNAVGSNRNLLEDQLPVLKEVMGGSAPATPPVLR